MNDTLATCISRYYLAAISNCTEIHNVRPLFMDFKALLSLLYSGRESNIFVSFLRKKGLRIPSTCSEFSRFNTTMLKLCVDKMKSVQGNV